MWCAAQSGAAPRATLYETTCHEGAEGKSMSEHTVASDLHWDNADRPFVPGPSLHDAAGEAIAESYDEFDNRFRIRVADKAGWRSRASSLIERRYAWRGYSASPLEGHTSGQVTLCA